MPFEKMPPINPTRSLFPDATTVRPVDRFVAILVAAIPCVFLIQADAIAADDDVLNVSVFAAQRYDSNLFKIPDGQQPFGTGRRSAATTSTGVGLQARKTYGLQTFDVDLTVTHDHYTPYDYLDATGRTLSASWAWSLTSALSGNLSIAQSEAPNNFSDTGVLTTSNKRKTEERRFDVNARPGAALHPRFSVIRSEDKSDQITLDRTNSSTTSLEAALVYEFRSGNSSEVYFRRGRGDYTDVGLLYTGQNDSRFDERETGVRAHWAWTGAVTVDGRLGYLDRSQNALQFANVRGPVGSLSLSYALTGKTALMVSASRGLTSVQSIFANYSVDQTLSVSPMWSITNKLTLRPSYSLTDRKFRGTLVPGADDLKMTMRDSTLQLDYAALRSLNLSFQVFESNRSSNNGIFQYRDHGGQVRGSFAF